MYESAALYAGGSGDAARLVASGEYDIAFNLSGGLHHAHPGRASGFCTFNDMALAIRILQDAGYQRVIYVDIDVHQGDGTQDCFYNDRDVLTISLHESGQFLFPGTGFPEETGGPDAPGSAINMPFFPYTLDDVWHDAFDAIVPAAFARFQPQAVVLQLGADAHWQDPLAHLLLTSQGWMRAVEKLLQLSANLPIVVTGGGGYNLKTVARLWTMVTAACAGISLPEEIPAEYAALYDIAHLHDHEIPDTEEDIKQKSRAYATDMLHRLNHAHGLD
jgi:acetoin utilization protein AcuC